MRRFSLVCAALIALAALARAQTGNQEKFKVSGTVQNLISGEIIRGALVELQGADPHSTMTGADGRFEIDDVKAGSYSLRARRPGFNALNDWQQITVGSSSIDSLVMKLSPLSRITGRITDREGEPIDGVTVRCLQQMVVNGRKRWQAMNSANTDETGSFAMEDLQQGSYLLSTSASPLYHPAKRNSEAARYMYPPTYFPNGTSRETAQPIELSAGQEMRADMELHSVRAAFVTVTAVNATGRVVGSVSTDEISNRPFVGVQGDESGTLTFSLPPGSWKIALRSAINPGQDPSDVLQAELPIEVGATDIDNLKVEMSKPVDIPLTISGVENQQVFVQLEAPNGGVRGSSPDRKGVLSVRSVSPGSYRTIISPGFDGCIVSASYGTTDLLRDPLVVSAGGAVNPIQIVLSKVCPVLNVKSNSKTMAIALVLSAQGYQPMPIGIPPNGTGTFKNLSAGDYQVYVFDDASDLEFANPDVMRGFKGKTVTLAPGDEKTLEAEVNERHSK